MLLVNIHNMEMDAIHYVPVFNCSKNLEILPSTALWHDSKQHLRPNCCWPIFPTTQAVVYLSCLNYFLYAGVLNMVVLHNNIVTSKSLCIEVVLVAGRFPCFFSFAFLRKTLIKLSRLIMHATLVFFCHNWLCALPHSSQAARHKEACQNSDSFCRWGFWDLFWCGKLPLCTLYQKLIHNADISDISKKKLHF